jgi:hypothetical protein
MDINNPNYHRVHEECEKQKKAFEELMGGRHAMMGNAWDPWNKIGISWGLYNDYKNKGYSDDEIADTIKESKPFPALDKIKKKVEDYKMRM